MDGHNTSHISTQKSSDTSHASTNGQNISLNGTRYPSIDKKSGSDSLSEGTKPVYADGNIQKDDDDDSGPCGWKRFQFACCQKFRNAKWFLVVLTLCGACQGMAVNGFVHTVISTVERRFELSSTESGLIASCYDIMFVILVVPVSYFGGHGHKPRYLGIGMFVLGVGSFVFTLPHFVTSKYKVADSSQLVCDLSSNSTDRCTLDTDFTLSNYKYLLYLGQLLHGAGATPLYTLGATFIDESVPQRSSAFYNGIFYTGSIVGPAIGYILGAKFLEFYTDLGVDPKSLGLDTNNPKWVGAWWIGFLISGTMAVFVSLPLLAFPAMLPGSKKYAFERGKETHASGQIDKTGQSRGLKDILLSIKCLLTNVPFMLINLAAAAHAVIVSGFSTFMPKFIEYKFGLSAATAALYVGLAAVPGGGGGTFAGGLVVKCFKLKVRGILRLGCVMSILLCPLGATLMMECDTAAFAGITLPYGQATVKSASFLGKNLVDTCNRNCSCTEENFFPICGRDKVLYFSPCYAGCQSTPADGQLKVCPRAPESFWLGLQWIVARCLGSIPGPILFGKMFDFACLVWQKRCHGDGSCFFYDNNKLSVYLLALSLAFSIAAAIFFLLACCFYKVKNAEDEMVLKIESPSIQSSMNTISSCANDLYAVPNKEKVAEGDTSDKHYMSSKL